MTPEKKRRVLAAIAALIVGGSLGFLFLRAKSAPEDMGNAEGPSALALGAHGVGESVSTHAAAQSSSARVSGVSPAAAQSGSVADGGEDAEIIEPLTRELRADYAPFITRFALSDRAIEVLLETLVGQFFSKSDEEWQEYEKLVQTMLTPESYAAFQRYRERIPRVKHADASLAQLHDAFPGISPDAAEEMHAALVNVKAPTTAFDELRLKSEPPSDADIERVRSEHSAAFDRRLKDLEPHVNPQHVDFLRQVYLQSAEVQTRLKLLKELQKARAGAEKN